MDSSKAEEEKQKIQKKANKLSKWAIFFHHAKSVYFLSTWTGTVS